MSEKTKKRISIRYACDAFVDQCLADARDISIRHLESFCDLIKEHNAELNIEHWQLAIHSFPVILAQNSQTIKYIFKDRADEIHDELDNSILDKTESLYNDSTKADNFLEVYKAYCEQWDKGIADSQSLNPERMYTMPTSYLSEFFIFILELDKYEGVFIFDTLSPTIEIFCNSFFLESFTTFWKQIDKEYTFDT
ncbi:MAG: hypothetical protein ACR2NW_04915 [Thermodesulfobacteriota bacterium]